LNLFSGRKTKSDDKRLIKKVNSRKNIVNTDNFKITGDTLLNKLRSINAIVAKEYVGQEDKYTIIYTEDQLILYIDRINKIGEFALDTETTSLDPITCTLAGIGIYVEGLNPAYIPINHVSYVTGIKIKGQLDSNNIRTQLLRLNEEVKIIFHNAKFDIRVLLNQLDINLSKFLWRDTMLAAPLLNENEAKGLKYLHNTYCSEGGNNKQYTELFKDVPFTYIPIDSAYFYGAKDALLTYELYKYQSQFLDYNNPICQEYGLVDIAHYYEDVEIPVVLALIEMEETGIEIDKQYAENLLEEFKEELKKCESVFYNICEKYKTEIKRYRLQKGLQCKLNDPILLSSPDQISILLYEIMEIEPIDKRDSKGTGKEILNKLLEYEDTKDIAEAILNYRTVAKLISTYVKKLPKDVKTKTGCLHTSFNQHIPVTGRLSSSGPCLQNIPVRGRLGKLIRSMFKAFKDHYMIFGDYSQQEPLLLADISGDDKLKQIAGEDVYAFMGSFTFSIPYEECLEKYLDGTLNLEGKRRREEMKTVILGIMYERQANTIADQLKITKKKAQGIIDKFYKTFPKIKIFRDEAIQHAIDYGYVTMLLGRKRRLPDMQLPKYSFKYISEGSNFDPLAGLDEEFIEDSSKEVDEDTIDSYYTILNKAWGYNQRRAIIEKAREEGIEIIDNSIKISEAIRQVVNSIIQGSAGVMTKNAMAKYKAHEAYQLLGRRPDYYKKLKPYIEESEELKNKGAKLILQVHDELALQGLKKYAKRFKEILKNIMIKSASDLISIPMKVDIDVVERWNGEKINV